MAALLRFARFNVNVMRSARPAALLLAAALATLATLSSTPAPAEDAQAAAQTLVLSRDTGSYHVSRALRWLEDPTQALDIAAVAAPQNAGRFQPARVASINDLNFGYSHSAYWLALEVTPEADAPAQWLLEIGYPSLDHVEVYTRDDAGGWLRQEAGDLQPFAQRPFQHRNLVFPLTLKQGQAQTVYLRVISQGNLTIPAMLWQRDALYKHDQTTYAELSLYYGMLLALGLYNLLLFLATRDSAFLAYVGFVAAMAVGQASMNGFGNQFVWPAWPAWGNVALPSGMSMAGFFGAQFTRLFLNVRDTSRRLDKLLLGIMTVFAFAAVSPALLSYRFAAILTSITGVIASAVIAGAGLYCLRRKHPGARWFLLAWAGLLAGVVVLAMRNLSWLPTNTLAIYSMQIGSAFEMLLLSFALADRINVMRREKDQANQEALSAKQVMVDTLRRSEHELETRVAARTLDLETANLQLKQKERELEHMARHDPLTGLANRVMLGDRIEQAIARAKRNDRGMAVLMVDLDGFKGVNDNYGHAAGDQLLLSIALRLGATVRETDTVARMGGDEFVVILEDLHSYDEIERVAEKLLLCVGKPVELAAGTVEVGASIGVAFFPGDATTPDGLLKLADHAMYAAKTAGRNRCHYAGSDHDI